MADEFPCPHVTLTRHQGDTLVCWDCGAFAFVDNLRFHNLAGIGGTVIQTIPDIAGRDIRTQTSDPDCEED